MAYGRLAPGPLNPHFPDTPHQLPFVTALHQGPYAHVWTATCTPTLSPHPPNSTYPAPPCRSKDQLPVVMGSAFKTFMGRSLPGLWAGGH